MADQEVGFSFVDEVFWGACELLWVSWGATWKLGISIIANEIFQPHDSKNDPA